MLLYKTIYHLIEIWYDVCVKIIIAYVNEGSLLKRQRWKGILLVLLGAGLWGSSSNAAQFLFQQADVSPTWLVEIRLFVSGIILLLYSLMKYGWNETFSIWIMWKNRFSILIFGIVGMLSVQITFFLAIQVGNAATATLLQYMAPIIILIYTSVRYLKLPHSVDGVSILFALVGTTMLMTGGNIEQLTISPMALFWGLLSAVSLAFYTLQPTELLKKFASPIVVGWGMLIGAVVFSFKQSLWEFSSSIFEEPSILLALIFVILFGTVLSFTMFLASYRYILPYEASVLSCFEPLTAVLIGVLFMNLSFSLWDWLGSMLIIMSVVLLARKEEVMKKNRSNRVALSDVVERK